MQLDSAGERDARLLERHQGIGVGGEVGLGDRRAAAVNFAVLYDPAISIDRPPVARWHGVAVGVERDYRSQPELFTYH